MKTTFQIILLLFSLSGSLIFAQAQDLKPIPIEIDLSAKKVSTDGMQTFFENEEIELEFLQGSTFEIFTKKEGYTVIQILDSYLRLSSKYVQNNKGTLENLEPLTYMILTNQQYSDIQKSNDPNLETFEVQVTVYPILEEVDLLYSLSKDFEEVASSSNIVFFKKETSIELEENDQLIVFDYLKESKSSVKKPLYQGKTVRNGKMVKLVFANFPEELTPLDIDYSFKDYHTENSESFSALFGIHKEETEPQSEEKSSAYKNFKDIEISDSLSYYFRKNFIDELLKQSDAYVSTIMQQSGINLSGKADYERFLFQFKRYVDGVDDVNLEVIEEVLSYFEASSTDTNKIIANLKYIEEHQSLLSVPIQIHDYDQFEVEVTYGSGTRNEKKLTYLYPIKGGFKLDFSTGLFCSFLTNDSYELIDAKDTEAGVAQQQIISGTDDNFKTGIGIMSHVYYRWGSYVNVGLSFGAVVENDVAVNWPAGVSLLWGRKSRIVVTGGVILGKADRLKSKYGVGELYEANSLNGVSNEDLVTDVTRARPFISLTYNFGSL